MTTQTAEQLAQDVDEVAKTYPDMAEVSAMLRSQAAEIARLRTALEACADWLDWMVQPTDDPKGAHARHIRLARAALGKQA